MTLSPPQLSARMIFLQFRRTHVYAASWLACEIPLLSAMQRTARRCILNHRFKHIRFREWCLCSAVQAKSVSSELTIARELGAIHCLRWARRRLPLVARRAVPCVERCAADGDPVLLTPRVMGSAVQGEIERTRSPGVSPSDPMQPGRHKREFEVRAWESRDSQMESDAAGCGTWKTIAPFASARADAANEWRPQLKPVRARPPSLHPRRCTASPRRASCRAAAAHGSA